MNGLELIAAERQRQINEEGFTASHDEDHNDNELAWAACYYAMPCMIMISCKCGQLHNITPYRMLEQSGWDESWGKRKGWNDRIRDLVKAGALIAAEIDRLQRRPDNDHTAD